MSLDANLRDAIAHALAASVKAHSLVEACVRLGLSSGEAKEAGLSKRNYVGRRLQEKNFEELLGIGEQVLASYGTSTLDGFRLKEALNRARAGGQERITGLTRKAILTDIAALGPIQGDRDISQFLANLWPLDAMPSHDLRHELLSGEIWRHMVANDDWTPEYLLDRLGVQAVSDQTFFEFLEALVHPETRRDDEQQRWVQVINGHLKRDRYLLEVDDFVSGYARYRVVSVETGIATTPKNLIFASTGPKPEIVLGDALHNDIHVVRNGQFCLFYDRPINGAQGLLWGELLDWWAQTHGLARDDIGTARNLFRRLQDSLQSQPEKVLFRAYFDGIPDSMRDALPALIPQVYLHFDPKTVRELHGKKRLPRQRMDFLLLLPERCRVVVEVDGIQHYAENGEASPLLYGEMAAADRQLRLCGYEIYRFGGHELADNDNGAACARAFFDGLFRRHGLSQLRAVMPESTRPAGTS